ncbi:MAG: AAA family ATPase [Xanthomonadales bacterium]|nr:AAA family ATPase [Xanthomonadales bacterium]
MTARIKDHEALLHALQNPALYPHAGHDIQLLETHISSVLLIGDYAYKIKKPVNLGFLDFESLEARRHFCEEELRLNRRLAPDLYLAVVPICGRAAQPELDGTGPPIEYAVKMRRFPQEALLDRQIEQGRVDLEVVDAIADEVAHFHGRIEVAPADSVFGEPDTVLAPMLHNFVEVAEHLTAPDVVSTLERIEDTTRNTWKCLEPRLEERKKSGFIRECHGDMHLRNVARLEGRIVIFDGIEFDPKLRWIDVVSEIAFMAMDLDHRGSPELAWRFLNRYVSWTGDYAGLDLLRFYQAYRAMVRAKVDAIQLGQTPDDDRDQTALLDDTRLLLDLAQDYLAGDEPALVLCAGLSGSGKTFFADRMARHFGLVHLRSDVERKRLFDLPPDADSRSRGDRDIYAPEATDRTYRRLETLTRSLLRARLPVAVDATFLTRSRRERFRELAADLNIPFRIFWLEAALPELENRIRMRAQRGTDASEADLEVLAAQRRRQHPPGTDEPATHCSSDRPLPEHSLVKWIGAL